MGTNLERWAARQVLPPGDYRVLIAMAQVAHDNTGKFWLHVDKFMQEYYDVHRMPSIWALRKHYASLARRGIIGRIRKGNGKWLDRTKNPPEGSSTKYQLLAYGELPAAAFKEFEAASRKRGDAQPPIAEPSMKLATVPSKPPVQSSLDGTSKPPVQSSLDGTSKPPVQSYMTTM